MNEGKIILGLIDKLKERSQSKNGKYGNTFLMGGGLKQWHSEVEKEIVM